MSHQQSCMGAGLLSGLTRKHAACSNLGYALCTSCLPAAACSAPQVMLRICDRVGTIRSPSFVSTLSASPLGGGSSGRKSATAVLLKGTTTASPPPRVTRPTQTHTSMTGRQPCARVTAKVSTSCCTLRPRTVPSPREINTKNTRWGLMWTDLNAGTPPGARGRSALSAGNDPDHLQLGAGGNETPADVYEIPTQEGHGVQASRVSEV